MTPSGTGASADRQKVTVPEIARRKQTGERISMITAYDATFARLVDEAGIDMILVGDSLGMVVQGVDNTIPVGLEEMAYHVQLVARTRPKALVVGDLPFGSYQVSPQQAVESSVALMKRGAEAVKLEGGTVMADTIEAISRIDIPVVGHIGLNHLHPAPVPPAGSRHLFSRLRLAQVVHHHIPALAGIPLGDGGADAGR